MSEPEPWKGRKYISVYFECCKVYQRIYIKRDQSGYVGWCPRCTKQVKVAIGPGGTQTRFFKAT